MVDHGYKYREGTPITEYYYNCGKVLGRLHQLSKDYNPVHRRYSIFDHYNNAYIEKVVPDSLPLLKEKLRQLLKTLEKLDIDRLSYGMVHFDYNDGNYMIDLETGDITVYDFDNSCYCWYMFDIASLWISGIGWIQREQKAEKRREFMNYYFKIAMEGYRSETNIEDSMLEQLPLFIQLTVMENIMDSFENMTNNAQNPEFDNCLSYCIKLMEEDISYLGFFHEIYSTKILLCMRSEIFSLQQMKAMTMLCC